MTSSHSDECSVASQSADRSDALGEFLWLAYVIEALGDGPAKVSAIAHRMRIKLDADYTTNRDAIRHTLSRLERQGRVTYAHHTTPRIKTWKLATNTSEDTQRAGEPPQHDVPAFIRAQIKEGE